ncbi:MAG: bifunctional (p)ppGpp synthetase/guanosine-3',5'-bis(diphosphate) 3'-pyrophosphohydrolase [Acidimicrobiia bacterium]|nr:bifunctional (p)ppGpp synthetase/guanosine-3',5'-bis(diphosphate) 3'-pyrophosphohydrolase [Acidimicrobiia bacterium]
MATEAEPRTDEALVAEVDPIVRVFSKTHRDVDVEPIIRAYDVAHRQHMGQFRMSGEPYITHPLAVALVLAEYGLDRDTIVAGILHDTVEDTDLTLDEVTKAFGSDVAALIDGVTKLDRVRFDSREVAQAATIRKMVVAMAQDLRVLLIKLTDRLHNLRTIDPLSPEKQQRIATESLEVYAPLAHRLGVQEIKHEMEDRCFQILMPGRYTEIEEQIQHRAPQREAFIEEAVEAVRGTLAESEIGAIVTGRPKHFYSIYRKMVTTGQPFEEIHDLIGIRIITENVRDCYGALGLIHTMWPPVHGRFKDYIAMPKFNLYQSLHTTVIGPGGKPLEVQIRSSEMHERAEYGIAAHWRYKEGAGSDLPWMADLRMLQEDHDDPEEFLTHLKLDLYEDEVFVLTPKGQVKTLPRGSTPIDFAYSIHTEVGHRCSGAKVNGRLVPLDTRLESGDIVEVMTSKATEAGPSRDWMKIVRTSRAKAKIRQWFSKERRDAALGEGRDKIAALLKKENLGLNAADRDRALKLVAQDLGHAELDSLYVAVGEGGSSASAVVHRVLRLVRPEESLDEDLLAPPKPRSEIRTGPGIIVEGLDDVWVRVARCCAPVPGDDIVGFVTVGRGVSVHRSDCTNIVAMGERRERMIEVAWAPERVGTFAVWVQVEALDRSGLLRDVTTAVSDLGGNITASSSATGRDRVAVLRYEVELSDPAQVERLVEDLRGVEGVYDAYRLVPGGSDR